jgi:enoyl-CoA hydratase/carnithine racemase
MNENILLAEEKDGVMVLSLNRPQVMNSLNFPLLHALREQVESVRFKTHTRVIIITGAGEKAFCAGADLKERATLTPDQVKEYIFTKLCQNVPFFKTGMNGILEIPLPWREGLGEGESGKDLHPISAKLFLRRETVKGLMRIYKSNG